MILRILSVLCGSGLAAPAGDWWEDVDDVLGPERRLKRLCGQLHVLAIDLYLNMGA